MNPPISIGLASVLSTCFRGQTNCPSHRELGEIFRRSGTSAFDPGAKTPSGDQIGKVGRVYRVVAGAASEEDPGGQTLIEGLIASLRAFGNFDPNAHERFLGHDTIDRLAVEFHATGWDFAPTGFLAPLVIDDLRWAERRPALERQISRIRNSTEDSQLILGTAKEMLESAAKYVLEGVGHATRGSEDYEELLYLARQRLGLLPEQAPDDPEKSAREVYEGLWRIARHVNFLRKSDGTGHGQTTVTRVQTRTARSIVQASAVLAQLLLDTLEDQYGASSSN
ncbi:MAG: abortive infection family protein [Dehalococcoidia bacterium]